MTRRRVFVLLLSLALVVLIWQLPRVLRAIPSRYVAAYLPRPVQALAARDHVETLPTPVIRTDTGGLLPDNTRAPLAATSTALASSASSYPIIPTPQITDTPQPTPTATPTPIPFQASARLENVRHQFQTWNNCGPATLAMALSYFDLRLTQDQTAVVLKPDPEDRNVSPSEMAAFVNEHTDVSALSRANGDLDTLRRLLSYGMPVIVELGIDPPGEYRWMGWYGHYLLVVAYDDTAGEVWVYDSWFGTSEVPGENADAQGRQIDYQELDRYWRQFNRNYIVLYRPEQASDVAAIVGENIDDDRMWRNSLAHVQSELASEPGDAFLWFNLGTVYDAQHDYQKASAAFDKARAIGLPWRMLWYQFGPYEAYYQVGRYEDVLTLADVTLQDRPYFEEAFYFKGLALSALGRDREAQQLFEKAVDFNPNFTPAAEALAQLGR